jgi:hypothetical protein
MNVRLFTYVHGRGEVILRTCLLVVSEFGPAAKVVMLNDTPRVMIELGRVWALRADGSDADRNAIFYR